MNATIAVALFVGAWLYVRNVSPPQKLASARRGDVKVETKEVETLAAVAAARKSSKKKVAASKVSAGAAKKDKVDKPVDKPADKPVDKPVAKPVDKPMVKHPDGAEAAAPFGMSKEEREDLLEELNELSPSEKAALLESWGGLTPEALAEAPPSTSDLDASLRGYREEMASLMYKAAYVEMDEAAQGVLVDRMRELKELTALQAELLELSRAEDFEVAQQAARRADRAAALSTPGAFATKRGAARCAPCAPIGGAHTLGGDSGAASTAAAAAAAAMAAAAAAAMGASSGSRAATAASCACAHCGAAETTGGSVSLKACSRCKAVEYCSRECQVAHWKAGRHKAVCKRV